VTVELSTIGLRAANLQSLPAPRAADLAAEVEDLGYSALWLTEGGPRDPLVIAALLLDATRDIVVATGVANIYARDPLAMVAAWYSLDDAFPARFLLGIGVSHRALVEDMRGHKYLPPLQAMTAYLDAMDAAPFPRPAVAPVRVLAALGPRMLALSAQRAAGAHPYVAPPEHTATARSTSGPEALLAPDQMVLLEDDADIARATARETLRIYLTLPNYLAHFRRCGFGVDDVANGGSDRLVDAVVAWGDEETVRGRVQAHLDAGADHVCVQALSTERGVPPVDQWRRLADALITVE